jgi:hypothetical protein
LQGTFRKDVVSERDCQWRQISFRILVELKPFADEDLNTPEVGDQQIATHADARALIIDPRYENLEQRPPINREDLTGHALPDRIQLRCHDIRILAAQVLNRDLVGRHLF